MVDNIKDSVSSFPAVAEPVPENIAVKLQADV